MVSFFRLFFPLIVFLPLLFSCQGNSLDFDDNQRIYVETDCIIVDSIRKTGLDVRNYYYENGAFHSAQGMAIHNSIMYRLFDTGFCQTYSIEDIDKPLYISSFPIGSFSEVNHCNCAQFIPELDGELYLYIAGLRGKCYVERITQDSSQLIQTISLKKLKIFNNSQRLNIICGDDGFLWLFGSDDGGRNLIFAKAKRPSLNEANAVLDINDIIDYWLESDYCYEDSVWQGGMVYSGNLFFVFGTKDSNRHIAIYNTYTHEKVNDIDLNDAVLEEPEDCDFFNDRIVLSINGGKGYYILELNSVE